jgi:hypothetical protein
LLGIEEGVIEANEVHDTIPSELKLHLFKDKSIPNLIKDYDILGFVAEHCLVKFNSPELFKLVIKAHFMELRNKEHFLGYPKEITEFDYKDYFEMYTTNAVFDITRGNIIKLNENQEVMHCIHGLER